MTPEPPPTRHPRTNLYRQLPRRGSSDIPELGERSWSVLEILQAGREAARSMASRGRNGVRRQARDWDSPPRSSATEGSGGPGRVEAGRVAARSMASRGRNGVRRQAQGWDSPPRSSATEGSGGPGRVEAGRVAARSMASRGRNALRRQAQGWDSPPRSSATEGSGGPGRTRTCNQKIMSLAPWLVRRIGSR